MTGRPQKNEHGDAYYVRSCCGGNADAYRSLVERYQDSVYATAFFYVRDAGAAEDVSQESFLAAYRGLRRLREPERFGPWLRQITCRCAANWLRRHNKRINSETPLPFRRTVSIEDVRQCPRGKLEQGERFELIQRALDSLPEHYRLPVVLRYVQELSYDEISAFTGETREEVRGILQRAGKRLRDLLADATADGSGDTQWHRARE